MKVREIIRLIEEDGWKLYGQKESHMIYEHPFKKRIVVVPNHGMSSDIKKGTKNNILTQGGKIIV